ncbi:MAG: hypothetical protein NZZ41_03390 [Candidatus Dojkabacteria bacterium]|nr:hypothetical protein [Candidatus Dojkabacteria bacterium]
MIYKYTINKLRSYLLGVYIISFVLLASFLRSLPVRAFVVTPSSGNLQIGVSQTFQIIASGVPTGANAVSIDISIIGPCVITSFAKSTAFDLEVGTNVTTTSIQTSLAKSGTGTISNGEIIGTFTVNCSGPGTLRINRGDQAAYSNGSTPTTLQPTTLATFSVTNDTPSTAIKYTDVILLIGLVIVLFGILTFVKVRNFQKSKK